VSDVLSTAVAGFVAYHSGCLAKSSIFAAYAAHGVAPITSEDHLSEADGLIAGTHYLVAGSADSSMLQPVASAANRWYQGHGRRAYVSAIADALRDSDVERAG
jgi:hypothetical protein